VEVNGNRKHSNYDTATIMTVKSFVVQAPLVFYKFLFYLRQC